MAYMCQERKKEIHQILKARLKKYNVKWSLKVHHHSEIVLTIRKGDIDFKGSINRMMQEEWDRWPDRPWMNSLYDADDYIQVNPYHYQDHFDGEALEFLKVAIPVLYIGNHDNSDIMTDYFDVGWWVSVHIGEYSKPYVYMGK